MEEAHPTIPIGGYVCGLFTSSTKWGLTLTARKKADNDDLGLCSTHHPPRIFSKSAELRMSESGLVLITCEEGRMHCPVAVLREGDGAQSSDCATLG